MKHKFNKLLTLGMCFSLMASSLVFATPVNQTVSATVSGMIVGTPSEALPDIPDYEHEEVLATASEVANPRNTELRTFLDYFPDPNFAQGVAEHLGKNKEDLTSLGELQRILILTLYSRNITSIDGIGFLKNLEQLTLQDNQITQIPAEISSLTKLHFLVLNCNQLTTLPEEFWELRAMQQLYFTSNHLTELSPSVDQMTRLYELVLNDNQLSELPEELYQMRNLSALRISANQFTSLPESIGGLEGLWLFEAYGNQLTDLPESFWSLANLSHVNLHSNQLINISPNVSNLNELEILALGNNQISTLPPEFYTLSHLINFNVAFNQLTELSPEIGTMASLVYIFVDGNQLQSLPDSIWGLPNLDMVSAAQNMLSEEFPETAYQIPLLVIAQQNNQLPPITITDEISYEMLIPPLYKQLKSINHGLLNATWYITDENNNVTYMTANDGSEIRLDIFPTPGSYEIKYVIHSDQLNLSHTMIYGMSSTINVTVETQQSRSHTVTLTTRYLDGVLPESTQTYTVADGGRFEQPFEVLDGYDLANTELRSFPDFDVDMDTKTVSLDPVERNYTIVLEFEKAQVTEHDVTVITRYLDDALPEHTATYQVPHGSSFLESFEVLEGYDLYNSMLRSQLVFDVDMDTKTVGLSTVEQDYTIELEFDKTEYKVKLNTRYLDNAYPATTQTDWVRHQEGYSQTYQIAEGYRVVNADQLPAGVAINEATNTVTISSVVQDYEINLEFDKKEYNVIIRIVYEDGSREDQVSTYMVSHGNNFGTDFTIEQGYAIKKVSFNAIGISINRSHQTISIGQVVSPVEISISVR